MLRILLFVVLFFSITNWTIGQSTSLEVHQVFQNKCASCHSNANPAAGLDLEGAGASAAAQAQDVYNNLVNVTPTNAFAASKNYKQIYPGRTDRSFLFRTINEDFEPYITTDIAEGDHTSTGAESLTDQEKELIRQWINFGAPANGTVIDSDLIEDYYTMNGVHSFPDGPPPAPAAGEGFQIKMGPFLLAPDAEVEFFQKYELDLPENAEVNRIDVKISNYSHHFLIYDFDEGGDTNIPAGLRLDPDHSQIGLVAALQEATDLRLPEGTAFKWKKDLVLDLNSHYINYSTSTTYMAEAYVNVYTQANGTAIQEMKTELIPYFNIQIPNNGNPVNYTDVINYNFGEIHLWGIMGHTHKYGTGYTASKRNLGQMGEMIYDASCPQGVPGCVSPYYDYQHIPMRYFDTFFPVTMNFSNGIFHEAQWVNDGSSTLYFGPTSDDEMMVIILMYVDDIEGLPTSVANIKPNLEGVRVFPNPMQTEAVFQFPSDVSDATLNLYDVLGQPVRSVAQNGNSEIILAKENLSTGIYFYKIKTQDGRFATGRLVIE